MHVKAIICRQFLYHLNIKTLMKTIFKTLTFSSFIFLILLVACKKESIVEFPNKEIYKVEKESSSQLLATLLIDGKLEETEDQILADLNIYDNDTYKGDLNLYGPKTFNITASNVSNDASISQIVARGNNQYEVITNEGHVYGLKDVKVTDGLMTGTLRTENSEGTASLKFKILSNQLIKDMDIEYNSQARAFPWLLIPAIGGLITIGSCAYERSQARADCHDSYTLTQINCGCNCTMSFDAGLCGGTCHVDCQTN